MDGLHDVVIGKGEEEEVSFVVCLFSSSWASSSLLSSSLCCDWNCYLPLPCLCLSRVWQDWSFGSDCFCLFVLSLFCTRFCGF